MNVDMISHDANVPSLRQFLLLSSGDLVSPLFEAARQPAKYIPPRFCSSLPAGLARLHPQQQASQQASTAMRTVSRTVFPGWSDKTQFPSAENSAEHSPEHSPEHEGGGSGEFQQSAFSMDEVGPALLRDYSILFQGREFWFRPHPARTTITNNS